MKAFASTVLALALVAMPTIVLAPSTAEAKSFCGSGNSSRFGVGAEFGSKITEADKQQFALMRLRRLGVDATSVEFWQGCIRAYVKQPGGGQHMEFYDPDSYERLD